jgi:hypothetical protein
MTGSCNAEVVYAGALWHGIIEELGTALRNKMDTEKIPQNTCKAFFSVFVEMMSNMMKYSAKKTESGFTKGSFFLFYKDGTCCAMSGNLIKIEDRDSLKNRIDNLNSMDKLSLRELYIKKLKKKGALKDKGAGIGLIEIAKCASTPIEYEFLPYNDELTFFTMRISVN